METKVIRLEDKNFEEEKIKMFQPKTLNKEEQLKNIFSGTIQMVIDTVKNDTKYFDNKVKNSIYIRNIVNNLLYEVKIRTKL